MSSPEGSVSRRIGLPKAGQPDAAQVAEEYQRLLDGLGSARLKAAAVAKPEDYTNAAIAAQLGLTARGVRRKLEMIRRKLQTLGEAAPGAQD